MHLGCDEAGADNNKVNGKRNMTDIFTEQMHDISDNLKFTVVTVALNSEKVIGKTIKSVLEQTYPPYEYFVIDGKSTDKTVEIAGSFYEEFKQKGIK